MSKPRHMTVVVRQEEDGSVVLTNACRSALQFVWGVWGAATLKSRERFHVHHSVVSYLLTNGGQS